MSIAEPKHAEIGLRLLPSLHELLHITAASEGVTPSALANDLILAADPSTLEPERSENRIMRSVDFDERELKQLARLAKKYGVSKGAVIEALIVEASE